MKRRNPPPSIPVTYRIGSILAAAILITAGVLKLNELNSTPLRLEDWFSNHVFIVVLANFELMLGVLLLSNLFPRVSAVVCSLVFFAFAVVSGYQVIEGSESCGCFGHLTVSPSIVFLVDSLALAFFLSYVRKLNVEWLPRHSRFRIGVSVLLMVASVVACRISINRWQTIRIFFPESARAESLPYQQGDFIQPSPDKWVGKEFALADQLEGVEGNFFAQHNDLAVVLYRTHCETCKRVLRQKIDESKRSGTVLLLVEIDGRKPPSFVEISESCDGIFLANLNRNIRWLIEPPLVVVIEDSAVFHVSSF